MNEESKSTRLRIENAKKERREERVRDQIPECTSLYPGRHGKEVILVGSFSPPWRQGQDDRTFRGVGTTLQHQENMVEPLGGGVSRSHCILTKKYGSRQR
ncbi:hypothetical protein AcV5_006229 [Taiwanofungus camphoratus]|nr:hypothetical protein AcV5_006229 [Antrodia cinnamomea]